jgi:hypothetical protein
MSEKNGLALRATSIDGGGRPTPRGPLGGGGLDLQLGFKPRSIVGAKKDAIW